MSRVKTFPITRLVSTNLTGEQGNSLELANSHERANSPELTEKPEREQSSVGRLAIDDTIASEEPLEIWLKHPLKQGGNASLLLTTMRSPGDDVALVTGWLHSSGLLANSADIQSVTHTGSERIKGNEANQILVTLHPQSDFDITSGQSQSGSHIEYVNSGCGVCGQRSIEVLLDKIPQRDMPNNASLLSNEVLSLANALRQQQTAFAATGGSHGAGLFVLPESADLNALQTGANRLIDVREDIGRHNALDKLIGANLPLLLVENTPEKPKEYGVVISSRISFDIVQKAAMANIGMILAMGAPSSLAIELAQECDICIAGFIGQNRINVYTCDHRIV
ncbi:formate dehydrogenase accessory sulfurtransferase FdhD [Paraglaciecola agarilytica]|uniref:formate dehydrogenase accessory sulfurtransferase FdhD n=1 Tax=Paraglaciecola chathamensis TaxID=368405 RepID=UPI001C089737|nr:formate dehydrogenase accessory sulfurtransferase FdhD [Paraglaciecola agarilytica]MBU3016901.1 formate dehydrogenase accessory sulfurtransferase FdhD [Paraglaciecola agarilytica]